MADSPLIVWWLGDGKPGHENQSLGLADALARRTDCEILRVPIDSTLRPFARIRAAAAASEDFPPPAVILAAGHATHLSLLWLARKCRAKSVVIMGPTLPAACFDLCIVPEHDFPKGVRSPRVLLTRGALNRVTPPPAGAARTGKMILIGGPSRTHGWTPEPLLAAIAEISAEGNWELTDSRRTPEPFLLEIEDRLPEIAIFPHQETSPDWLPAKLAAADEVWVTEDSVSMIYEALSSGARVGILPVPRTDPKSRVPRGLDKLTGAGFLTPFAAWQETRHLSAPPELLREADRCAKKVLELVSPRG